MRVVLALAFTLVGATAACQSAPPCGSTPCPIGAAFLYSPCGFKSVTSTCSGTNLDGGTIRGAAGETCTVTVTYGEGTTVTSKLAFRAGDDCCPFVRLASETPRLFPPATCVADAGVDGSTDSSADAGAPD